VLVDLGPTFAGHVIAFFVIVAIYIYSLGLCTTRSPAVARIADRTGFSDLQCYPRSMISISSNKAYATFNY